MIGSARRPPRRLFASWLPPAGGQVLLDPAASGHARVLRLEVGDPVCLFNGQGKEATGRIAGQEGERVLCEVEPPSRVDVDRGRVRLVQCLPKGTKLDGIVRMTTELGVDEIHLVESERSVSRLPASRAASRHARLSRIAQEAARQSGLETIPAIHTPCSFEEVIERIAADVSDSERWVLTPVGASIGPEASSSALWLVVGPEGGLTLREIDLLTQAGFQAVQLAATTLRVETAAPVAVGLALDRLARAGHHTPTH